jgi:hypothetical protein
MGFGQLVKPQALGVVQETLALERELVDFRAHGYSAAVRSSS